MSENYGDFLAGIVIGGVLGFVTGVLVAPASGEETRSKIADKGHEVAEQAREGVNEVKGKADEVSSKVKGNVNRVVDTVKEKVPKKGEDNSQSEQELI